MAANRRPLTLLAVIAFIALALALGLRTDGSIAADAESSASVPSSADVPSSASAPTSAVPQLSSVPQNVYDVLDIIDRTGEAPDGYRGGTQFMNDGRGGGQVLPREDATGRPITYREWDVNPYTGANRGSERLVTGSDGSAWYTDDHYDTFVRIR
jgi:guanyl-specific ribonuclease Sa